MMIPKIIHYCWFGHAPLPPLAVKCIASWKKFLPDYEIKEWNESNFDVNMIPYTAEAYKARKYAFVSDYARFWIIYHYGGVYFDTDVEIIRSMDDILSKGPYMGFEWNPGRNTYGSVAPGLGFAADKGNKVIKMILDSYAQSNFEINPITLRPSATVIEFTTDVLVKCGLEKKKGIQNVSGINVYPAEYFAPIHFITKRLHITSNTHTIHQYMASWADKKMPLKKKMKRFIPEWMLLLFSRIKHPEIY